jgi:hypothetical protein
MEILLESALRSTLFALVVGGLLTMLRVRSPRLAHRAWLGVALAMLLLPAVVAWGPQASIGLPVESPRWVPVEIPNAPSATIEWNAAAASHVTSPAAGRRVDWERLALLAYGLGAALLLLRLALGLQQALRLRHEATLIAGRLAHPRCHTPVTVGLRAPVVVLPVDWVEWPAAELQAVLAHEEEHVRRRDPLVAFVTLVARAVFWFHPLAWWLHSRVATLAEQACDAEVLSRGHDADAYAASLLRFARSLSRHRGRILAAGTAMPGASLQARLQMLDRAPAPPASAARRWTVTVACGAAIALCAAATPSTAPAPRAQLSPPQQVGADWQVSSSEHFEIYYQREQANRVQDLAWVAEQAYAHLTSALKYDLASRVPVILVARNSDLPEAAAQPVGLVAPGLEPGRSRIVMSTESLDSRPGIMVHELTHSFAFEILPEASRTAPWLMEGLAEHQRGAWDADEVRGVREAIASGWIPEIEALASADHYWSHALFDYVADAYGSEGIRRYLFALRTRPNGADAIPVAFDTPVGDFNQAFRAYVQTRFGER